MSTSLRPERPALVGLVGVALLLAGCTGNGRDRADEGESVDESPATDQGPADDLPVEPAPGEYLPGLSASVDLPEGEPGAVVVLVPGGSWTTADPTGLAPLAADLTAGGYAVVTITYGTSSTGAVHPRPALDIACAVAYAAEQVPEVPVVLVGHSAGAHLAALVGLAPDREDATCPYRPAAADAVVGLAGPYDVARSGAVAESLFGGSLSEDEDLWRDGNPLTWVGEHPEVPYLLVHGEDDDVVPMSFTDAFATALADAGHEVAVERLPGVDHLTIFTPEAVGDLVAEWVGRTVLGG